MSLRRRRNIKKKRKSCANRSKTVFYAGKRKKEEPFSEPGWSRTFSHGVTQAKKEISRCSTRHAASYIYDSFFAEQLVICGLFSLQLYWRGLYSSTREKATSLPHARAVFIRHFYLAMPFPSVKAGTGPSISGSLPLFFFLAFPFFQLKRNWLISFDYGYLIFFFFLPAGQ